MPSSSSTGKADAAPLHLMASGVAAIINFPLWRAAAMAQSGFVVPGANAVARYMNAVFMPPYKGVIATVVGMTWARAAIFFGSDWGKQHLEQLGVPLSISLLAPPLCIATSVQLINMPLVRASITIQNPGSDIRGVFAAVMHIYRTKGLAALWHGYSAGVLKAVPKYMTAIVVKDFMEKRLPHPEDPLDRYARLRRAALKSGAAGLAGAVLTNPLDVLRNEMFKTEQSLAACARSLWQAHGTNFLFRGITSNMTAVAIPITTTIFLTDLLVQANEQGW